METCKACEKGLDFSKVRLGDLTFCMDCFFEGIPDSVSKSNPNYEELNRSRKEAIENREKELLKKYSE